MSTPTELEENAIKLEEYIQERQAHMQVLLEAIRVRLVRLPVHTCKYPGNNDQYIWVGGVRNVFTDLEYTLSDALGYAEKLDALASLNEVVE